MNLKETKKHTKHTALTKPVGGDYHRNEWSIIGAPCDFITAFANSINEQIGAQLKIGYMEADHQETELDNPFHFLYEDKISHQSYHFLQKPMQKQHRKFYNHLDLLLVNGNHFLGDQQIVLINEKKKISLSKKLERLTNVKMILVQESESEIYDFLQELFADRETIPVLKVSDMEGIGKLILEDFRLSTPPLNGLILSGGKSVRMGMDKGTIDYHGKPQREYEAGLIAGHCETTYISCRKDQEINSAYQKMEDTFVGLGPYSGILSAFRKNPNHAWLSLACDLPYINQQVIDHLVANRDPRKLATCFYNPETDFPEPLITIWEPRAYSVLLEFLSQGYSCPRKVLINSDVALLQIDDPSLMVNANFPEEMAMAKEKLGKT